MLTDEQRKARIATVLKWGLGLVAAAVIAPVIFLAVQGLVGLALALLTAGVIVHAAPVVALKLAAWRVSGMKAVARSNPIEVREKIALDRHAALEERLRSITAYDSEVRGFAGEITKLEEQYPQDAAQFKAQLETCMRLLEHQRDEYRKATATLKEFEAATRRARARWKVAQSALRMQRLSGQQADTAMEKILADESLDSVQSAMDNAFAGLESSILQIEASRANTPALTHQPAEVIDLPLATKKEVSR